MLDNLSKNGLHEKKKKVLFLCDDPRFNSGIATMAREIILGTCHVFDYAVVGGALKHPEEGKIVDISNSIKQEIGVDCSVKIYPVSGYGTQELVRNLLTVENPDLLLHFTDPRYWTWLYQIDHEIRQRIPITYLNIWDCSPPPMYNKPYYKSCDLLMNISKQTYGLVHKVLKGENYKDWQITYVPHGINDKMFYPIGTSSAEYSQVLELRKTFFKNIKDINDSFVFLFNSRNIRRKQIPDIILAYKLFCDSLTKEEASKCVLMLHTQPVDENGTNLIEVIETLCPEYNVQFTEKSLDVKNMNLLYNASDVLINISSNEGWGLSATEAIMCGKCVIVNMTGGLQDQVGLMKDDGTLVTKEDYKDENWHSNHDGKYSNHGPWAIPIIPSNRSIQGSVPTPYIFDDRVKFEDVAEAMKTWYNTSKEERDAAGIKGRQYLFDNKMNASGMCENVINDITTCLQNFKPKERFSLNKL
jgi:glycosyltransferase involved in cell wall biosynthesis